MSSKNVVMLLDNAFAPDMRVQKEALSIKELGCNITIVAWDRECKYPIDDEKEGIKIKRIRTKSKFQLGFRQLFFLTIFYIKAMPYLLRKRMDIIYCHDMLMLPLGIIIKLFKRKKLVYDAHEIYWIMETKKYNKFISGAIKYTEVFLLKFVDRFITVSEQRAEYYRQYYNKPIYIVGNYYNPIDINLARRKEIRQKLGIDDEKVLITYIGSLNSTREFELLIKYAANNKNVFVVIAGSGYWQNMIQEAAEKLDNLKYLGWVSNPIDYYSASDIIYYLLKENYKYNHYNAPNNLYLSIALKVPIVVNDIGIAGDVVRNCGIGAIADVSNPEGFSEAVNYIIKNKEIIATNLGKCQSYYSWDMSQKALKEMLNSLL